MIVIVGGVAGSGKTTVGERLAGRLRWRFADADTFHPDANIAKMRSGHPLTDSDRLPWLRSVRGWIDERVQAGQSGVLACSALKRSYRDLLLAGRPEAEIVMLSVDREVLAKRVASRAGHFFPDALLDSQFADLELPGPDEPRVRLVTAEDDPAATAAKIIAVLWPYGLDGAEAGPVPGVL